MRGGFLGVLVLGVALAACAPTVRPPVREPAQALVPVPAWDMPAFEDDGDRASLEQALGRSLAWLRERPPKQPFLFGPHLVTAEQVVATLEAFLELLATEPDPRRFRQAVQRRFRVYQAVGRDGEGEVLFTGYYEPELPGSRIPTARFRYPLYRLPEDLVSIPLEAFHPRYRGQRLVGRVVGRQVLPYATRAEIDGLGILEGRGLELVWLEDPVDVFFLQIQGSGRIRLEDGTWIRVHYAGSNGRPYRSIGRLLIREGAVSREAMSLQRLKAYLRDHPERREAILNYNESYVFFEEVAEGPLGSLGFPLTPGRSVATDLALFPPAALAFIRTQQPVVEEGTVSDWKPLTRFVLNQDSGGAIKGPGRVDVFFGSGSRAEAAAGHLKHPGELYFLLLRET